MPTRPSWLRPALQPDAAVQTGKTAPAQDRHFSARAGRGSRNSHIILPGIPLGDGGRPMQVLLDPSMLGSLETLMRESAPGSSEIGGLLLGRNVKGPEPGLLIEGYVGLSWDETAGGAPRLLPRQLAVLQQKLAAWRSRRPSDLHAVGYYRTARNGELELQETDRKLRAEYFNDLHDVTLLMQPAPHMATVGVLYYHRGDAPDSDPVSSDFVFDDSASYLPGKQTGFQPNRLLTWAKLQWKNLAVAALVAAAAFLYPSDPLAKKPIPEAAPSPVAPSLDLRVTRVGNELHVSWNRNSKIISAAPQGFLSITDGGVSKLIPLDRPQLLGAQFLYSPLSGDVSLKLEVFTEDQERHAEAVRVYAAGTWSMPAADRPGGIGGLPGGLVPPSSANVPMDLGASRTATLDSIREAIARAPWQPEKASPGTVESPAPQASPAAASLLPRRQIQVFAPQLDTWLAPPKVEPVSSVSHHPAAMAGAVLPAPPPVASFDTPAADSQKGAASTEGAISAAISPVSAAQPAATRRQLTDPQGIQIGPPSLGADVRRMVPRGAIITIRARVNAEGKVIDAEAIPRKQTGILGYITALSVSNARNWRFKPATQDGVPVASEATIRLKF